ncbi:MAG TPA: 5'-3' exonuclease H3TH domain-containing protein [Patescibacteria group bacterium]|nr:5'-3' exonuclease H3TH domain-containing protein [Patescibacteria group bacterium]
MKANKQKPPATFLLVDGNAIIHRAFHALPATLTDRQGRPTNAVFGFARIFLSALKQFRPNHVAVAVDMPGKTFRDDLFAEYKAKRVKAPQELYDQIPLVKDFLTSLEVPCFGVEGYEADDVIGTLAKRIPEELKDAEVIILTGDGDALQLINRQVKVALPQRGLQPPTLFDSVAVAGRYGLTPAQIIDYKALRGDASDNIPGVPGIGEKTATELLKTFRSVKNLYQNLAKVASDATRAKLEKGRTMAELSQKLARIDTNVSLDFKLGDTKVHDFDRSSAEKFLRELGMTSVIARLPMSHRQNGDQVALF